MSLLNQAAQRLLHGLHMRRLVGIILLALLLGLQNVTAAAPPTITTFTPDRGQVGTSVTITGTGFTGATNVQFDGADTTFTVNSNTQITATVPLGTGSGAITVMTPEGSATSGGSFQIVPRITGFTPTRGPVGTTVTITGTGFKDAVYAYFNQTRTNITADSDTQITATVPMGATSGPIMVVSRYWSWHSDTSTSNFTVTMTVDDITPNVAPIGASVVIRGTGFTDASEVKFNTTPATNFTVNSGTQITATVPVGTTSGPITVTSPAGTNVSSTSFFVKPTITSFTPTSGRTGTSVTITGTGLSEVSWVQFNGTNANFTSDSSTQITATVPNGATTGPITVINHYRNITDTSASNFTVTMSITDIAPNAAPVGANVIISGVGFTSATSVQFNGTPATNFSVNSNTQITATVPAGVTSGPISVTGPGGTVSGAHFSVAPDVGTHLEKGE